MRRAARPDPHRRHSPPEAQGLALQESTRAQSWLVELQRIITMRTVPRQHPLVQINTWHLSAADERLLAYFALHRDAFPPIEAGLIAHTDFGFLMWIDDEGTTVAKPSRCARRVFHPASRISSLASGARSAASVTYC